VSHIKPEHLLEPRDYRQWMKIQASDDGGAGEQSRVDDVLFESLSKRAWMDVLLQLVKVSIPVCIYSFIRSCVRLLIHSFLYPVI